MGSMMGVLRRDRVLHGWMQMVQALAVGVASVVVPVEKAVAAVAAARVAVAVPVLAKVMEKVGRLLLASGFVEVECLISLLFP